MEEAKATELPERSGSVRAAAIAVEEDSGLMPPPLGTAYMSSPPVSSRSGSIDDQSKSYPPKSPPSGGIVERTITLPENVRPGMKLKVKVGGRTSTVVIPDGVFPGQKIKMRVKLPPKKEPSKEDRIVESIHQREPEPMATPKTAHEMRNFMVQEAQRTFNAVIRGDTGDPVKDFFSTWTRFQLTELLVLSGVELRNERLISMERLIEVCCKLYEEDVMNGHPPERPRTPSTEEMAYMNAVVLKVQRHWIQLNAAQAQERMLKELENDRYAMRNMHRGGEGEESFEGYSRYTSSKDLALPRLPGVAAPRAPAFVPPSRGLSSPVGSRRSGRFGAQDEESGKAQELEWLERPWKAPKYTKPKKKKRKSDSRYEYQQAAKDTVEGFQNATHPRKGTGKDMHPFPWDASLGRHCWLEGWGEQLDLWNEGKVSEFAQFGPGIVLYFKFVKFLYWTFIILSILYMPMIVINMYGEGIVDASGLSSLAQTTIGNLGNPSNISSLEIPGCKNFNFLLEELFQDESTCVVDKKELGLFYAFLDVLAMIFVVVGIRWLQEFEMQESQSLDRMSVSPSDYTIRIPWVPPAATETNIRDYFQRDGKKVYMIFFGYDDGDLIKAYTDRANLLYQKYVLGQKIRYYRTKLRAEHKTVEENSEMTCCEWLSSFYDGRYTTKTEGYLLKQRGLITQEIQDLDLSLSAEQEQTWYQPLCAFVSFNEERHMVQAIAENQRSSLRRFINYLGCWKVKDQMFLGQYFLNCQRAPAPSTIIWENIKFGYLARLKRRSITNALSLAAIFASILVSATSEHYQSTRLTQKEAAVCPDDFEDWSERDQKEYVEQENELQKNLDYTHCYCNLLSYQEQANSRLCRNFYYDTMVIVLLQVAAVVMVAGTNAFITVVLNKMAKSFEKHHSMDGIESSVFIRVFVLKFIGTGLLYIILNIDFLQEIAGENDLNDDFSLEWYSSVAPLIVAVMLSNMVAPHGPVLFRYYKMRRRVEIYELNDVQGIDAPRKTDGIFCQDQLNEMYLGPEFHLHLRYAQVLVVYFVCMMYGIGIPILMPIGALHFFTTFWFDKMMFIRFYRLPPYYDESVSTQASNLLVPGVLIHLAVSGWMLSNGAIFSSKQNFETQEAAEQYAGDASNDQFFIRVTQQHVLPITAYFVILVAYILVKFFFGKSFSIMRTLLTCFTSSLTSEATKVQNLAQVTYENARARGIIKGLPTYNVLLNPVYRDAFRVDIRWVLAEGHKHVASVKKFNFEQVGSSAKRMTPKARTPTSKLQRDDSGGSYSRDPPQPRQGSPRRGSTPSRGPGGYTTASI